MTVYCSVADETDLDRPYRIRLTPAGATDVDLSAAVSLEESFKTMVQEVQRLKYTDFENPCYYNIQWMRLLQEAQHVIEVTGSVFDYRPAQIRSLQPPREGHG